MPVELSPLFSLHPGLWLRDEMVKPHKVQIAELARHLGVSRQALSGLLNGKADLTADMAIRFEKAFGLSADSLCRMQSAFALAQARADAGDIKVTLWE